MTDADDPQITSEQAAGKYLLSRVDDALEEVRRADSQDVTVSPDDVDNYHRDEQYIEVRHRPQTDTPIKNKKDGERLVALSDDICMLLDDWLEDQRPNVTDDYGRELLVATRQDRAHKTTLKE